MCVMLVGKMEVLREQETKEAIWRKGDTCSIRREFRIQIIVF